MGHALSFADASVAGKMPCAGPILDARRLGRLPARRQGRLDLLNDFKGAYCGLAASACGEAAAGAPSRFGDGNRCTV